MSLFPFGAADEAPDPLLWLFPLWCSAPSGPRCEFDELEDEAPAPPCKPRVVPPRRLGIVSPVGGRSWKEEVDEAEADPCCAVPWAASFPFSDWKLGPSSAVL